MIIRELTIAEMDSCVPRLAAILMNAVDAEAGVSFLSPLSKDVAEAFWIKQVPDIGKEATTLFVAETDGKIAGTVMLQKAWAPNQPHRCEVAKLLVHTDFRKRGIGTKLMQALEGRARKLGFTLITFDTVAHGSVEKFYHDLGFTLVGYIPDYAMTTKGGLHDTALFYKKLTRP